MKRVFFILSFILLNLGVSAQELPYKSIFKAPESYSAASVTSRMIDGLGYRFYWATEGLREQDLNYGPQGEGRNIKQTVKHIYDLCQLVMLSVDKQMDSVQGSDDFQVLRAETLKALHATSVKLRAMSDEEVAKIDFRGFPFWNVINGPVSDAIYHTGQIVLLRRMSGNPMNPKVNVLTGVNNQ